MNGSIDPLDEFPSYRSQLQQFRADGDDDDILRQVASKWRLEDLEAEGKLSTEQKYFLEDNRYNYHADFYNAVVNEQNGPSQFTKMRSKRSSSKEKGTAKDPGLLATMSSGFSAGVDQLQGIGGGLMAIAGDLSGSDIMKKAGQDIYLANVAEAEKSWEGGKKVNFTDDWGDGAEFASNLTHWVAGTLGEQVPNIASMFAGGGAGTLLARTVGKALVKRQISKEAGKRMVKKLMREGVGKGYIQGMAKKGAKAGVLATGVGVGSGSIYGQIFQETGESAPLASLTGGAIVGLLDSILPGHVLGKLNKMGATKGLADKILNSPYLSAQIAKGVVGEGLTEALQTAVEQETLAYVDDNREMFDFTKQDRDEIINAMAAGSLLGGGFGMIPSNKYHGDNYKGKGKRLYKDADKKLWSYEVGSSGVENVTPVNEDGTVRESDPKTKRETEESLDTLIEVGRDRIDEGGVTQESSELPTEPLEDIDGQAPVEDEAFEAPEGPTEQSLEAEQLKERRAQKAKERSQRNQPPKAEKKESASVRAFRETFGVGPGTYLGNHAQEVVAQEQFEEDVQAKRQTAEGQKQLKKDALAAGWDTKGDPGEFLVAKRLGEVKDKASAKTESGPVEPQAETEETTQSTEELSATLEKAMNPATQGIKMEEEQGRKDVDAGLSRDELIAKANALGDQKSPFRKAYMKGVREQMSQKEASDKVEERLQKDKDEAAKAKESLEQFGPEKTLETARREHGAMPNVAGDKRSLEIWKATVEGRPPKLREVGRVIESETANFKEFRFQADKSVVNRGQKPKKSTAKKTDIDSAIRDDLDGKKTPELREIANSLAGPGEKAPGRGLEKIKLFIRNKWTLAGKTPVFLGLKTKTAIRKASREEGISVADPKTKDTKSDIRDMNDSYLEGRKRLAKEFESDNDKRDALNGDKTFRDLPKNNALRAEMEAVAEQGVKDQAKEDRQSGNAKLASAKRGAGGAALDEGMRKKLESSTKEELEAELEAEKKSTEAWLDKKDEATGETNRERIAREEREAEDQEELFSKSDTAPNSIPDGMPKDLLVALEQFRRKYASLKDADLIVDMSMPDEDNAKIKGNTIHINGNLLQDGKGLVNQEKLGAILFHEDLVHRWLEKADPARYNALRKKALRGDDQFARQIAKVKALHSPSDQMTYLDGDGNLNKTGAEEVIAYYIQDNWNSLDTPMVGLMRRFNYWIRKKLPWADESKASIESIIQGGFEKYRQGKALADTKEESKAKPEEKFSKTRTEIVGNLDQLKKEYPEAHAAVISNLKRRPVKERSRITKNLKKHKNTGWSMATIRSLMINEVFESGLEGADVKGLMSSGVWGKDNLGRYGTIKSFLLGKDAVRRQVMTYDFISDNRKAEHAFSGSFINCDPSKDCAKFCYAAKGQTANTPSLIKAEFTEWASKNHPEMLVDNIADSYAREAASDHGLALRINDKGELSPSTVEVVKGLNKRGIRIQIFSKRPELLNKVPDFNLKMLSIDSTNFELAQKNPKFELAVTITDGMTEEMLTEINDRVAVYLPVQLNGKSLKKPELKEAFPNLFRDMREKLCPVDAIGMKPNAGEFGFVSITQKKPGAKGHWTCTTCDKLGTVGCYHGDKKSETVRKAYENSLAKADSDPKKIDRAFVELKSKVDELLQLGAIDGTTHATILREANEGRRDVRKPNRSQKAGIKYGVDGEESGQDGAGRGADGQRAGAEVQERSADVGGTGPSVAEGDSKAETVEWNLDSWSESNPTDGDKGATIPLPVLTKRVKDGNTDVGVVKITTPDEAAVAARSIAKKGSEQVIFFLTDKDGKPLSAMRHSIGSATRSAVDPSKLAKEMIGQKDAKGLWMAHNHPTGTMSHSDADKEVLKMAFNITRGTGILVDGSVIVGPEGKYVTMPTYGGAETIGDILETTGTNRIPNTSIDVVSLSKNEKHRVNGPDDALDLADKLPGESGLMIFDTKNRPVAFVEMTDDEMQNLRGERQRKIYQALADSNGTAMISYTKGEKSLRPVAENIKKLSNALQLRYLDTISKGKTSLAAIGASPNTADEVFFSKADKTDTPQFKRWFGDSKVVDEGGNPLVVSHGGINSINIFSEDFGGETTADNEHGAFYFSDSSEVADDYARQSFIRRYQDDPEGMVDSEIITQEEFDKLEEDAVDWYRYVEEIADDNSNRMDVYLKMENPFVIDAGGQNLRDLEEVFNIQNAIGHIKGKQVEVPDQMMEMADFDPDAVEDYKDEIQEKALEDNDIDDPADLDEWMIEEAKMEVLEENGYYREYEQYDGIVIKNVIDDISNLSSFNQDLYIATNPTQIKSATNNTGAFDPENPDIRYSKSLDKKAPVEDRDLFLEDLRASDTTPFEWNEADGRWVNGEDEIIFDDGKFIAQGWDEDKDDYVDYGKFDTMGEAMKATGVKMEDKPKADRIIDFASGSNQADHLGAVRESEKLEPGFTMIGANKKTYDMAVDTLNNGEQVFFDSGAFTAFKKNWSAKDKVAGIEKAMEGYQKIVDGVEDKDNLKNLTVVGPDVIADPVATEVLRRRFKRQSSSLINQGVRFVVPVQANLTAGPKAIVEQSVSSYKKAVKLYGPDIALGLPMNENALEPMEAVQIIEQTGAKDVHLLGLGGNRQESAQIISRIPGDVKVSMDSNKRTSSKILGDGKPLTERERDAAKTVKEYRDEGVHAFMYDEANRLVESKFPEEETDKNKIEQEYQRINDDLIAIMNEIGVSSAHLDGDTRFIADESETIGEMLDKYEFYIDSTTEMFLEDLVNNDIQSPSPDALKKMISRVVDRRIKDSAKILDGNQKRMFEQDDMSDFFGRTGEYEDSVESFLGERQGNTGQQFDQTLSQPKEAEPMNIGEAMDNAIKKDEPKSELEDFFKFSKREVVDKPAFKKWFGNSKVVDEKGEPLITYHGTAEEFNVFNINEFGFPRDQAAFFTGSEEVAKGFATLKDYRNQGKDRVVAAYLSIENPAELGNVDDDVTMQELWERAGLTDLPRPLTGWQFEGTQELWRWFSEEEEVFRELKKEGFDGISGTEKGAPVYAVFKPTQIKSATGNNGDFDPNNPDIRYSKSDKYDEEIMDVLNGLKDGEVDPSDAYYMLRDLDVPPEIEEILDRYDEDYQEYLSQGMRMDPVHEDNLERGLSSIAKDEYKFSKAKPPEPKGLTRTVDRDGFYKKTEDVISRIKFKTIRPRDLIHQVKSKISKEEWEDLGMDHFLSEDRRYTRDEILDYVRKGGPTLEMQELSGGLNRRQMIERLMDENIDEAKDVIKNGDVYEVYEPNGDIIGEYETRQKAIDALREEIYDLYDGQHYFEIKEEYMNVFGRADEDSHYSEYSTSGGSNYTEHLLKMPGLDYMAPHFDDDGANLLAHARTSEMPNKTLMIEEIQSDAHQEARKSGYKIKNFEKKIADLRERYRQAEDERYIHRLKNRKAIQQPWREDPEAKSAIEKDIELTERIRDLESERRHLVRGNKSVPGEAPIKNSWPMYMFKKMLKEAVDTGKKYIAWAPGSAQVDRYPGQDGLKTFYDQNLPSMVKRYISDKGGKLERRKAKDGAKTHDYWVVELNDELKQSVSEGQPMYSKADKSDPDVKFAKSKRGRDALSSGLKQLINPDKVEKRPQEEGLGVYVRNRANETTRKLFDRYLPLKSLGDDIYVQARMSQGYQSTMQMFLDHGDLSWKDNVPTVETKDMGFMPWAKKIGLDSLEDFVLWRVGNRAEQLKRRGKEHLFDNEQIRELKSRGDGLPVKEWNKILTQINDNVLDFAVESGVLHPSIRNRFQEDFYIPFYRVMDDDGQEGFYNIAAKKGGKNIDNYIKKIKGGNIPMKDPFENMIKNWSTLISNAISNKARDAAIKKMEPLDLATEVDFKTVNDKKLDRILSHMVDGERKHYRIEDEAMLMALTHDPSLLDNVVMRALNLPKKTLTYGATFGPAFKAANLIRDSLTVALTHKNFNPVLDAFKGFWGAWKQDPDYIRMMASGGGFAQGYDEAGSLDSVKNAFRYMMKGDRSGSATKIANSIRFNAKEKSFAKTILDSPKAMIAFWDRIGAATENASRLGLYKRSKKKGDTELEAGFKARDIMDFQLSGASNSVRYLNATMPFMNARLQGLYKLGRSAKENPARLYWGLAGIGMASAVLMGARDEEKYKELEDWDKFSYWHFWVGDNHYRIPKPFELSIVPNMVEHSVQQLNKEVEGKEIWNFIRHNIFETMNFGFPLLDSAALKPIAEDWANKSTFTGRAIVPMNLEEDPSGHQYQPWTSDTLKLLGEKTGLSPLRVQHYLRSYFGTLTEAILTPSDYVVRSVAGYPARPAMQMPDVPLFGRFMRGDAPARGTRYKTKYFDTLKEFQEVQKAIKSYRDKGDMDMAQDIISDKKWSLKLKARSKGMQAKISSLYKRARAIWSNPKLTAEEKRDQLEQVTKQQNEIFKRFYDEYRRLRNEN